MLEDDIFKQWLDDEASRVLAKLKTEVPLDQDDKLIIVIKGQMNHLHHLDVELRQEMKALRKDMDRRFERIDRRFEQMDRRFEQMDRRFEQMDSRFDAMGQRMERFMVWSFGVTVGVAAVMITILKWPT